MLSLMQLLFYKQPTIAEEVSKILTGAIQQINMDEVFKENYTFFAFLHLDKIDPVWQRQVHELPELWPQLVDVIKRDELSTIFKMECQELNLPVDEYNLDIAFHKAQNEWAQELMVSTADYILKWNEDKVISTPVAAWCAGRIRVDIGQCVKYRDYIFDDYMSELSHIVFSFM